MKLIKNLKRCKTKIQEEIKMKTQVFKNSETTATSNLLMLAIMIILSGILLVANNKESSFSGNSFSKPLTNQENEKLLLNSKTIDEAVIKENQTAKNTASEIEFSMVKMHEYLIPETEPEFTVNMANSIVFPEVKTDNFSVVNSKVNSDNFLLKLKHQANEKTNEAVEYFAMEKKVKEFLSIETEKPLCLEEWMLSGKCWCNEPEEKLAFSEEN
jgi:hypothetical protein